MNEEPIAELEALRKPRNVMVDGGRRLGRWGAIVGSSFELHNLLSKTAAMLGSDKFRELYLRTDDLKIFRLDERGRVIDLSESAKAGKIIYHQLAPAEIAQLAMQDVTVGKPFVWGATTTAPIQEFVAATMKLYRQEYLEALTGSKRNQIIDEFRAALTKTEVDEDEFLGQLY